jgi:hypothetical protein
MTDVLRGLPGSMMPAIYGSSYQIVQGPTPSSSSTMITRVPARQPAHVGKGIHTYMGIPRGRWTVTRWWSRTNFKDQTAYRGASGDTLRPPERLADRRRPWSGPSPLMIRRHGEAGRFDELTRRIPVSSRSLRLHSNYGCGTS